MNEYIRKNAIRCNIILLGLPWDIERRILGVIDKEPSADVREVKRAKWVKYPAVTECSNCKNWIGVNEHPRFCSRCGAEMELAT